MSAGLFSSYSTGENRVTASILAVLQRLSLGRIERLLGALLESEFGLVRFQNQPSRGGESVPDAEILSSCRLLVETKRTRNSIKKPDQMVRHLKRLDLAKEETRLRLVLTPDHIRPPVFDQIHDDRLVWAPFARLDESIEKLLDDKYEAISEREAFLLRELQTMLVEEHLVGSAEDVLIVPARLAWPMYEQFHAYVCQARRSFRPVKRIAFYCDGQIPPLVPAILEVHEEVIFTHDAHRGAVGVLVNALLDAGKAREAQANKIMLLSPPEDARTIRLDNPIVNNLESQSGGGTAFTQNQRYVSLERLKSARTTSELLDIQ